MNTASNCLTDLYSANFSNSVQQKIIKLEPMILLRFPSFSLPNHCVYEPSLKYSFLKLVSHFHICVVVYTW